MTFPTLEHLLLQPPAELDPAIFALIAPIAITSRAASSLNGDQAGYKGVLAFMARHGLTTLPDLAGVLKFYHEDSQLVGPQSMRNRRKALSLLYKYFRQENWTHHPLAREYLRARMREAAPAKQKDPLTDRVLQAAIHQCELDEHDLVGRRDASILALLRAGRRGAEWSALDFARDCTIHENAMSVHIGSSKTDQYHEGETIWLLRESNPRYCPIALLERWREVYHGTPIYCTMNNNGTVRDHRLSAAAMRDIVKKYVEKLGYDPTQWGAHSGRAGYVTTGYARNMSEADMLARTGQGSVDVLRKYRRYTPEFHQSMPQQMGD